jgi:hypothetical protein
MRSMPARHATQQTTTIAALAMLSASATPDVLSSMKCHSLSSLLPGDIVIIFWLDQTKLSCVLLTERNCTRAVAVLLGRPSLVQPSCRAVTACELRIMYNYPQTKVSGPVGAQNATRRPAIKAVPGPLEVLAIYMCCRIGRAQYGVNRSGHRYNCRAHYGVARSSR